MRNKEQSIKLNYDSTETEIINGPMSVDFYGSNIATVIGTLTGKGKDKNGKAFSKYHAWANTYMERNGKWQCITSGGTLVPEKK